MDDIYTLTEGTITTTISPDEISNNINNILLSKIKKEIEGKCSNIGYIQKGSLKIIQKSLGSHLVSHFNGTILYNIKYIASVCNPFEGMILKVTVVNINKMGILALGGDDDPAPLNVLLAKQHHINNDYFNELKERDIIKVKVIGKRFEYGNNQISIIATLVEDEDIKLQYEQETDISDLEDNYELPPSPTYLPSSPSASVVPKEESVSPSSPPGSPGPSESPSESVSGDTVFQYYNKSVDKSPGKGTGEKLGPEGSDSYKTLASFKSWRKRLDNTWEQAFTVDGSKWLTVEHYYQANKFKKGAPEFYSTFSLDSESALSKDPAMAKAAGEKSGKYKKELIRPKNVKIDSDFNERETEVLETALRYKFTQHEDLKDILKATGNATLQQYVRGNDPKISYSLMKIRDEL